MYSQPMDMTGNNVGAVGAAVGAVGPAVGHRGSGFMPMSALGSGSRTMSPRRRGAPSASGPGARHGSAEPSPSRVPGSAGSAARRDREREPRFNAARNRAMGPQETTDWDKLIEDIHNRLETLERNGRNNAQYMGKVTTVAEEMKHVSDVLKQDYPQYKEYNEGRFKTIEEGTIKAVDTINGKLEIAENNFTISNDRFNVVNVQIASLEHTFGSLGQHVDELRQKLDSLAQATHDHMSNH